MECVNTAYELCTGAIIGDGDRKRGIHAAPSKRKNVLFLEKIAPPSTSETRVGTRNFAYNEGALDMIDNQQGAYAPKWLTLFDIKQARVE